MTRVDTADGRPPSTGVPRGRAQPVGPDVPGARARRPGPKLGQVVVVTAGTSDLPVAEEARVTAEAWNCDVMLVADVGVAGLHRLLRPARDAFDGADALVVVAGMEGALPSVVGGLVDCPVIAVPTSVGYGASFGGLAALLDDAQQLRLERGGREHRRGFQRRPRRRADRPPGGAGPEVGLGGTCGVRNAGGSMRKGGGTMTERLTGQD